MTGPAHPIPTDPGPIVPSTPGPDPSTPGLIRPSPIGPSAPGADPSTPGPDPSTSGLIRPSPIGPSAPGADPSTSGLIRPSPIGPSAPGADPSAPGPIGLSASAPGPDGSEGIEARLRRGLRSLGLPEDAAPSMARYAALLEERNAVMDLTAVTGEAEIASLHFLDSAAVLTAGIPLSERSLIDVGSGAGFPGIPLRLIDPTIRLSLLDARRKRVEFLDEVCAALDLDDVIRIHGRAEELGASGGPYRETFDGAVSRAVASMPILAELCLPLVRTGGVFLAMKSVHCGDELEQARPAIGILGGEIERIWDYPVPDTEVVHRLIAIRKVCPTPDAYPRPFARMKKRPLGGTVRR